MTEEPNLMFYFKTYFFEIFMFLGWLIAVLGKGAISDHFFPVWAKMAQITA